MEYPEIIRNVCLGIGLSACCGFRVFIPLLIANIAHHLNVYELEGSFVWIGSWGATILFSIAAILEVVAYYIPWLDNILDTIALPCAIIAGALLMTASITGLDPQMRWALGIITGATAAGTIQLGTAITRLGSSTLTAGLGNSVVSNTENGSAVTFSILAFVIPIVISICLSVVFLIAVYLIIRRLFRKSSA